MRKKRKKKKVEEGTGRRVRRGRNEGGEEEGKGRQQGGAKRKGKRREEKREEQRALERNRVPNAFEVLVPFHCQAQLNPCTWVPRDAFYSCNNSPSFIEASSSSFLTLSANRYLPPIKIQMLRILEAYRHAC